MDLLFIMSFLTKYNQYKHLLLEGTIKTISYPLQQYVLTHSLFLPKDTQYNDLADHLKVFLDKQINIFKSQIKHEIESIKSKVDMDLQFESWLYDLTATWYKLRVEDDNLDYESSEQMQYNTNCYNIPELYTKWKQICKSPKIEKQFKNIQTFKNLEELKQFVESNKILLLKKINPNFNKVYSNQKFDIYAIGIKDKQLFQQMYGNDGYNCGWCVVNPDKYMFEHYLGGSEYLDEVDSHKFYYLWTYKGTTKPFALLHKESHQFKDIHNESMNYKDEKVKYDLNILDGLSHIIPYSEWQFCLHEGDFNGYAHQVLKHSRSEKSLGQFCCDYVWADAGVTYNPETNTIDCHGNKIKFTDECFNDNGTFDFKLVNMNQDISGLFYHCNLLKYLPNHFNIPEGTVKCKHMFYNCEGLIKLPDNFKIPKSVQNCSRMFEYCINLHLLPGSFKIENTDIFNNEDNLADMFYSSGLTYEDVEYVLKNSNCPDDLIQTITDCII